MKQTSLKQYTPLKSIKGFNQNTPYLNQRRKALKKYSNSKVIQYDLRFSKMIIERDKRCLNCGSNSMLSCSHFYGRSNYATRFDPFNCITLCIPCHDIWESKKDQVYKWFMMEWLGDEDFYSLEQRSKLKVSPKEALLKAEEMIKLLDNEIQY